MASMQLAPAGHSALTRHWGAASPGVTQRPAEQTIAGPQLQQSELLAHAVRQAPLMHMAPPVQSWLALQAGRGRSSARQSPSTQRSRGPHPASVVQTGWQVALMHTPPFAQSLLRTHCPPPRGSALQNPDEQRRPVPHPASLVHARWQPPSKHRAPVPH